MPNSNWRTWVLICVALALAAALVWRVVARRNESLAGMDPDAARIEQYRRKGDVEALAREVGSAKVRVAALAIEALGYLTPKSLPHLKQAMQDSRAEVRVKAAIALGRSGRREEAGLLAKVATEDKSADVRGAAVTGLAQLHAYSHMEALLVAMEDPDLMVRKRAGDAVTYIAGIDFGYKPDGSPTHRRSVAARIRALWPKMEQIVRRHYEEGRHKPRR